MSVRLAINGTSGIMESLNMNKWAMKKAKKLKLIFRVMGWTVSGESEEITLYERILYLCDYVKKEYDATGQGFVASGRLAVRYDGEEYELFLQIGAW